MAILFFEMNKRSTKKFIRFEREQKKVIRFTGDVLRLRIGLAKGLLEKRGAG